MGDRNNENGKGYFNPWTFGSAIAGAGGLFFLIKFYQDNSIKQNYGNISDSKIKSNNNSYNKSYQSQGEINKTDNSSVTHTNAPRVLNYHIYEDKNEEVLKRLD